MPRPPSDPPEPLEPQPKPPKASIEITDPPPESTVAGETFVLRGTARGKVSVTPSHSVTQSGPILFPGGNWEAIVPIPSPGPFTVNATAFIELDFGSNEKSTSRQLIADDVLPPSLTIDSPQANTKIPTKEVTVSGTASDSQSGVEAVEWSLDGVNWVPITGGLANWTVSIPLPHLRKYTISVRARDRHKKLLSEPRTVGIEAVDITPPALSLVEPQPDAVITGTNQGANISVMVKATDDQTGVKSVTCILDGSQTFHAKQTAAGSEIWAATVAITTPGRHSIVVSGQDNATPSNAAPLTPFTITVAVGYDPQDPTEIFSPLAYLQDLMDFAVHRIAGGNSTTPINRKVLVEAFHQSFEELFIYRQAAKRSVSQVRLCIEILRKYYDQHGLTVPSETEEQYRQIAYKTLLHHLGTSFDEIRLVRAPDTDPKARQGLAIRLGIDLEPVRPDQLDRLLLDEKMSESDLEKMFGLATTTHPNLQGLPELHCELLTWQLHRLHDSWKQQDTSGSSLKGHLPIIDPDIVREADLKDPSPENPAYSLWKDRKDWIKKKLAELKTARESESKHLKGFDKVVTSAIAPIDDLLALAEDRKNGLEVESRLTAIHLSSAAFSHLLLLRSLAASDSVMKSEWTDLYAISMQVLKERMYSAWREAEQQKNIVLSPKYFKRASTPADADTSFAMMWRAPVQSRTAWDDTLGARIKQSEGLIAAFQDTIRAVEEVVLPLLRDGLVKVIAGARDFTLVVNDLTQGLLIDLQNSGAQRTTRADQAIVTLQELLFSLRAGSLAEESTLPIPLPASNWLLLQSEDQFDREWKWMGSYATWRAALFTFLYTDNALLPYLRSDATQEFHDLMDEVGQKRPLSPQIAREKAKVYLEKAKVYLDRMKQTLGVTLPPDFALTERRNQQELLQLAAEIKAIANNAVQFTPEALVKVQEIFFFVPLYLASELQQSGQYLAALDWFQTVYAFDLPLKQRKIYHWLVLEESLPTKYHRPPDWLDDIKLDPHVIAKDRANSYTRYTILSLVRCVLDFADSEFSLDTGESLTRARSLYLTALDLLDAPEIKEVENNGAPMSAGVRFPPNPVLRGLRLHAELNLLKLRNGRNIAGMQRQSDFDNTQSASNAGMPAIGSDGQIIPPERAVHRPTPYYYDTLADRAKQLVGIAQQIEAAYLAALEKFDDEGYTLLMARQGLGLAGATVQLQDLRVREADESIELTELQKRRSKIQRDTYGGWIEQKENKHEKALFENYKSQRNAKLGIAISDALMSASQAGLSMSGASMAGMLTAIPALIAVGVATAGRYSSTVLANEAEFNAQVNSLRASQERREQEWRLQKSLASEDVAIAEQQSHIALGQKGIVYQERNISQLQVSHAQVMVDFLTTRFKNPDLYRWMSGVLGRVYGYFLQQATAVAKMAESQLFFERQERVPSYIKADYWETPSDRAAAENQNGKKTDRRGLTGSARLLEDLYRLDQHAFETNKRKLSLSQTFSLARLAPFEFEEFRQSGVLPFMTSMELFDRGFPGHYLRLIKRVRVSVIALIPPVQGIRATLSTSGISRVVVGGQAFETVIIRRDPELIAFTSPTNATGIMELDPESKMLLPFEAMGVETIWEVQLPKAANRFDYQTIADVLLTIEYTALHSSDYRQQVIRSLNPEFRGERAVSFRDELPDEWYSLHNPDQSNRPMTIHFLITPQDFPNNIDDVKIDQMVLYIDRDSKNGFEVPLRFVRLTASGQQDATVGGGAQTVDGVISTRRANGSSWNSMIGKSPIGQWEFILEDTADLRKAFRNEQIKDMLFVISYAGRTPPWPAF